MIDLNSDFALKEEPVTGHTSTKGWLTFLAGGYVAVALMFLMLKWAVIPSLSLYKDELSYWVSARTGQTVQLADMGAEMVGFNVYFSLSNVSFLDENRRQTFGVEKVNGAISLWSLLTLSPDFINLELIKPHVQVDKDTDGWRLAGFDLSEEVSPEQSDSPLVSWLLDQHRVMAAQASIQLNVSGRSDPFYLDGVGFYALASAGKHDLKLKVQRASWLDQPLLLHAAFERPFWGKQKTNLSLWQGQLYVKGVLHSTQQNPFPVDPPAFLNLAYWPSAAQVEAWAFFDQGRVNQLTAYGELESLALLPFEKLDANVKVSKASSWLFVDDYDPHASTWSAIFKSLAISVLDPGTSQVDLGPLNGRIGRTEQDDTLTLTAGLDDLNAQTALRFARRLASTSWVDPDWSDQLAQFSASGVIKGFDISLRLLKDEPFQFAKAGFESSLIFEDLSVEHQNPESLQKTGFEGFSGRISGDDKSGTWSISAGNSKVVLQELFDEKVLEFQSLKGQGGWSRQQEAAEGGLEFNFEELSARNSDLEAVVRGQYRFVQNDPDWMNVEGLIKRAQVAQVPAYLPNVLGEEVRLWLQGALQAGIAENASFIAKGPVQEFPFHGTQDSDKRFEIEIPIRQASLLFAPDWPLIEEITGLVKIEGKALKVQADHAVTKGVRLSPVNAVVENMDAYEPLLRIDGLAQGELDRLVSYVNSSPLTFFVGGALLQAQVEGSAQLKLGLEIPLAKAQGTLVNGNLLFDNNRVRLVSGMPWVKDLQGQIDFSENGFQLTDVKGRALGQPLKLSGGSSRGELRIKAAGRATAEGLSDYLNPLLKPYLEGEAAFDVVVQSASGLPVISVTSDLKGLGVGLPHPFFKAKEDVLRFNLRRTSSGAVQTWNAGLTAPGQPRASATAGLDSAGHLLFLNAGLGKLEPIDKQGINISMDLPELDLQAWSKAVDGLIGKNKASDQAAAGLMADLMVSGAGKRQPVRADLFTKSLRVSSTRFESVRLVAKSIEDRWQFDMDSSAVKGYFSWGKTEQQPNGVVLGRFEKLTIPRTLDGEVQDLVDDPVRSIPALDIRADSFILGDMVLGQLVLEAENPTLAEKVQAKLNSQPQTWTLTRLEITNPDSVTTAKGIWRYSDDLKEQLTRITLDQQVSNAGGLLERLGNRGVFRGGNGSLKGQVSWSGPPSRIDYKSLSGELDLKSQKGQFLKADPGVAKLLGVLSLQGITRRLSLDFNDLFSQGFAYDDLVASFDLKNGKASTPNFKMIGPSATVLMDGQLDLAEETQNLNVVVLPDLNATGGSLIYSVVAANPAVGIASLIADFLLKDPLSKVFSLQYKVTGAWSEPNIRRLERVTPNIDQEQAVP